MAAEPDPKVPLPKAFASFLRLRLVVSVGTIQKASEASVNSARKRTARPSGWSVEYSRFRTFFPAGSEATYGDIIHRNRRDRNALRLPAAAEVH
jgi:hypothetical protein